MANPVNLYPYEIVDHATGVEGSYCISQRVDGAPAFRAYWNPSGWAGSGFVFTDRRFAESVVTLLAKNRALESELAAAKDDLEISRKLKAEMFDRHIENCQISQEEIDALKARERLVDTIADLRRQLAERDATVEAELTTVARIVITGSHGAANNAVREDHPEFCAALDAYVQGHVDAEVSAYRQRVFELLDKLRTQRAYSWHDIEDVLCTAAARSKVRHTRAGK